MNKQAILTAFYKAQIMRIIEETTNPETLDFIHRVLTEVVKEEKQNGSVS